MEITTASAQATREFGQKIGHYLITQPAHPQVGGEKDPQLAWLSSLDVPPTLRLRLVTLRGELGTGKTTFVNGLATSLGLDGRILSPTFLLVRRYGLRDVPFSWLYHIDLYRVQHESDVANMGLEEMITDEHALVVIEWPERVPTLRTKSGIHLTFTVKSPNERQILLQAIT
jgi:tRNA threonylcarbamoyladenosine biosynthesis protein TsaE